ncbi:MAG: CTP synthase [Candidatus Taylorbacteria bacterium RIFOXYD2_FULL_36_9]|uniref:CTP synthase n=1 Tax=Candidatus Taylorbacteria bacterium RIFOXYD2_FULL_36_9 TaxID=1802338 RepID=A0A1G2PD52_9BACT|nr:MAG: CTP synthase [Candidatus Taylorbacteria bacterium RIFOXYD2_FULL_36_9]
MDHKYIFVTGGVMSGVGKGIATSSIGALLQAKGFSVNLLKVDPYLNVDAGTMNPTEHGETFVLNSGLETDQDMGNYERFLNRDLTHDDYITSGMVYQHVISAERTLKYGGHCVEAIPHIRDEIIRRFEHSAKTNKSDITVVEIGGTVGDYQNIMFIEAARTMKVYHPHDVAFVMVSYMPVPKKLGEMKSKPTQNAIRQLNSYGVNTDIIIARSEMPMDHKRKEKIAISCSVPVDQVISAPDIESVFDVPLNFEKDNLGNILLKVLNLRHKKENTGMAEWEVFAQKVKIVKKPVHIAIVGKYFNTGDFVLTDAYVSVLEAIKYSAYKLGYKPVIHTVNARDFEGEKIKKNKFQELKKFDGIIVPGGFGESGIEGKLAVIRYAREKKIPYFGLCYGMQLMVIEYARNVLNLKDANTAEINPQSSALVIDIMLDQKRKLAEGNYGGSMRLGSYEAILKKGTVAFEAYNKESIFERHRHRYEVNTDYVEKLTSAGMVFSGRSPDGKLMEIAELPKKVHPFFLGTQFHPEFLARPLNPHPLFTAFLKASLKKKK